MQSNNYFSEFYVKSSRNSNDSRINNYGNFGQQLPDFPETVPTIIHDVAGEVQCIDNLRCVEEIPLQYRSTFASYPFFNIIQSQVLDVVLYSDEPVVVSAPTGSGKTVIFELAITRFLMSLESYNQQMPYKIVYVAPMKALCEERLVDWHCKFTSLGLTCISVTGDSNNFDFQSLLSHNLIITTPEKWDSLTRRWRDNKRLVALVKLFMIDEVHLLSEDQRGPTLEAIVSRMKTIQDSLMTDGNTAFSSKKIRFVAVSATIPNAEDIAEWLSMPTVQARAFKFGDDMRPVKLKKVVLGYPYNPQTSTPFKFDIMLNYKLQSIMLQYAEGKPTLIFCGTRKNVEMTARHITQNITINLNPQQKQILQAARASITEGKVRETLVSGVSYHHAGLSLEDRKIIEGLFRNANLPILVTTSTLAMGVNLPAHLVIIKSTKNYSNGEYRDYSECMLLQMIGRAGRPQFDVSATAVILTTAADKQKYESMVGGEQPVESNLHKHLAEHLNAEVVLHTITDLGVAMQWLTSTFLHIRARKHPRHYGLPVGLTPDQIDKKLLDMCQIEINRLARGGMLTIDQNDIIITPTNTGLLMAKYCVAFDTMKLFTQVTGNEILQQVLALISKCQEFSEIYLRVNDKKTLNLLNKCRNRQTIRFPFSGKIKTVDMKINCIIQAVFGCLQILEQSLVTESQKIMRIGERISNCLAEYLETKGSCYSALLSALVLAKCFHARLWENSPFVSKQLAGIGSAFSAALVAAGKTTFKDLLDTNPRDIERIINRKAPMGNTIQEQVQHLPDYELSLEEVTGEGKFSVNVKVRLRNALLLQTQSSVDVNNNMNLLVGDTNNNIFVYEKYKHSYLIENPEITKTLDFPTTYEQEVKAHLISEDWVGIDCVSLLLPLTAQRNADSRKEATAKRARKVDTGKKPSHIQTLMDTFFKKTKITDKNQDRKQAIAPKSSTKKSDGNKENIADMIPENSLTKQLERAPKSNHSDSENLPQSQALQKLIDDSVQECSRLGKSQKSPQVLESERSRGYCLPPNLAESFSLANSSSASLICSNGYSATARRNLEPNASSAGTSAIERKSDSSKLNKFGNGNMGFRSTFKISQLRPVAKKKQFRFKENMNCTVNFENSLHGSLSSDEEDDASKGISLMFKYTPRKKYDHEVAASKMNEHPELNDSDIQLQNEQYRITELIKPKTDSKNKGSQSRIEACLENAPQKTDAASSGTSKFSENFQKTLTWRSPLVTSPAIKYSPILGDNVRQPQRYADGNVNMSFSSWCNNTPPVRESRANVTFGVSVNDSAEMSGPSSATPSETSSTVKPPTSSRPTLKENLRKNMVNLPLSDQGYLHSVSQRESSYAEYSSNPKGGRYVEDELVSTSLLESLGLIQEKPDRSQASCSMLSQNQHGIGSSQAKRAKSAKVATVSDYYSQLVADLRKREPLALAEEKREVTESPRLKNDDARKAEIMGSDLNSPSNSDDSISLMRQQSRNSQSLRNTEKPPAFDLSFNDSAINGSHVSQPFNLGSKSLLNKSLTQPSAKNFNHEQPRRFDLPTSSSNYQHSFFSPTFETPRSFGNESRPFVEQLPQTQRHCFSQGPNHFGVAAPHTPPTRLLGMSQASNDGSQRTHMRKRLGRYCSPNFTILPSQPIQQERGHPPNCRCLDCVQHFRNGIQKPPVLNFGYYSQPPPGHAASCYAHMPQVEPNRYFEQPQSYHGLPQDWETEDSTCNFEPAVYGNVKRQKLETHHHVPSISRRYSFHDYDSRFAHAHRSGENVCSTKHRHCSFHEDNPPARIYVPLSEHPYDERLPHFDGFGTEHLPVYNQGDKQFILQRYLHSVERKQMGHHDNVQTERQPLRFAKQLVDIDDIEARCDDEFSQD